MNDIIAFFVSMLRAFLTTFSKALPYSGRRGISTLVASVIIVVIVVVGGVLIYLILVAPGQSITTYP